MITVVDNKSEVQAEIIKGTLCNDLRSGAFKYFNEEIDDVEIMKGSVFQMNKNNEWEKLTMGGGSEVRSYGRGKWQKKFGCM